MHASTYGTCEVTAMATWELLIQFMSYHENYLVCKVGVFVKTEKYPLALKEFQVTKERNPWDATET